jgi:phosphoenolpyruvate-protein kinase (PTS system EI component)
MTDPDLHLQGMAYVPGLGRGVLRRGSGGADTVALVGQAEAIEISSDPAALIVVDGAPLSHRMIRLVGRGIPTVLIDTAQAARLRPGDMVLVDGASGRITGFPATAAPPNRGVPARPVAGQPIQLADGAAVWLLASVPGVRETAEAVAQGAAGIGLVRSEFLGADQLCPPDAAYFTAAFKELCLVASPLSITVRLIDLAADKPPRWLPQARELLGPLGKQGSRLFDLQPVRSVLQAQLEALATLSEQFEIEVLIPYLSRHEELTRWIPEVRRLLPKGVSVGTMLETPAALLDVANWVGHADFFAIGGNDLMQCLFGADRDTPELRSQLDPYAPVLYRLLGKVAEVMRDSPDRIRVCGVLPRLSGILPLLVGLGFRRFSIDSIWIPYLARDLGALTIDAAEALANGVRRCEEASAVRELLGIPAPHSSESITLA